MSDAAEAIEYTLRGIRVGRDGAEPERLMDDLMATQVRHALMANLRLSGFVIVPRAAALSEEPSMSATGSTADA